MAGVAQSKQASRTCFSLFGPPKQVFNSLDKKNECCRLCLEDDSRLDGLEVYQGHIKLFHFALVRMSAATIPFAGHSFTQDNEFLGACDSERPMICGDYFSGGLSVGELSG
jgi:hypothetical protein